MPKVSERHLESRRREILEAAWRCFGREGFHRTTMRDICREADLSAGAVYRYFDGKEALIRAVAEEGRKASAARITPAEEAADPAEALAGSLARFLECLAAPEAIEAVRIDIRLCAEALHEAQVRNVVLENFEDLFDRFEALVRRGRKLGAFAGSAPSRAVARVVVALYQGLEFQKGLEPELDLDGCARAARELLDGTFPRTDAGAAR